MNIYRKWLLNDNLQVIRSAKVLIIYTIEARLFLSNEKGFFDKRRDYNDKKGSGRKLTVGGVRITDISIVSSAGSPFRMMTKPQN
jgi:hypothetical protein